MIMCGHVLNNLVSNPPSAKANVAPVIRCSLITVFGPRIPQPIMKVVAVDCPRRPYCPTQCVEVHLITPALNHCVLSTYVHTRTQRKLKAGPIQPFCLRPMSPTCKKLYFEVSASTGVKQNTFRITSACQPLCILIPPPHVIIDHHSAHIIHTGA